MLVDSIRGMELIVKAEEREDTLQNVALIEQWMVDSNGDTSLGLFLRKTGMGLTQQGIGLSLGPGDGEDKNVPLGFSPPFLQPISSPAAPGPWTHEARKEGTDAPIPMGEKIPKE